VIAYSTCLVEAVTGSARRGIVQSVFRAAANILFPDGFLLSLNAFDASRVPNSLQLSAPAGTFPFTDLRVGQPVLLGAKRLHIEALALSLDLTHCKQWNPKIIRLEQVNMAVIAKNGQWLAEYVANHHSGYARTGHPSPGHPSPGHPSPGHPRGVSLPWTDEAAGLSSMVGIPLAGVLDAGWGDDGDGMDAGWGDDGDGMDAGWGDDGDGMDAGWGDDGDGMDAGWGDDGDGMDAGWGDDGDGMDAGQIGNGNDLGVQEMAHLICGRGPGLTPSGDDILAGWMAVNWLLHGPQPHLLAAYQQILAVAERQTHLLSRCWLRYAAAGYVAEPIGVLLQALTCEHEAELLAATRAVLALGATSGLDVIHGILLGLAGIAAW